MQNQNFEKLFLGDVLSKRERVELTLNHKPVDRVPILEQLSYNSGVISMYTGKPIDGFNYTVDDICQVIRKTTDMIMPPVAPRGTEKVSNDDGFIFQNDNWTSWHISRPFTDEAGARDWLLRRIQKIKKANCDPDFAWLYGKESKDCLEGVSAETLKKWYRDYTLSTQQQIGDTVLLNFSLTGFCSVYDSMGLDIFTLFYIYYPEVMQEFMEASIDIEIRRVHAVADVELSPVILIPEDFSHKGGPIFDPDFLRQFHYPYIKRLSDAWHEHGIKVIYHTDGNYKPALPDLMANGVDGFYCLEKNAGMNIVELKNTYPDYVWAGGVDGVELMERGSIEQIKAEVKSHILETDALNTGGMFIASSSEINPTVPPESFRAMIEAVGETVK